MKSLFCLPAVAVCLFSCCAFAGVSYRQTKIADAPFDMPVLNEPVFPNRDFIISDFGASSDGKKCTEAIAKAMEACSAAGGGRVVVPAGRWLTGAVHFRSNCNLHLAEGAVLEFSDDPADYPLVQATWGGIEFRVEFRG
jgi:polygalacturonase